MGAQATALARNNFDAERNARRLLALLKRTVHEANVDRVASSSYLLRERTQQ